MKNVLKDIQLALIYKLKKNMYRKNKNHNRIK
jgi:hypothetical protein